MFRPLPFVLLLLLTSAGCGAAPREPDGPATDGVREAVSLEFTGRVTFVPLEGGFFGILADDGRRFDPVDLPPRWKRDGARVRVIALPLTGTVGFHMWGTPIQVLEIGEP